MIDVYLGTPYTHKDSRIQKWRFDRVTEATALLLMAGEYKTIYSPITHSHLINAARLDTKALSWDFWVDSFDLNFLAICKELLILQLPGWEESKGVAVEIAFALANAIPIKMAIPEYDEMFRIKKVRIEK